MARSRRFLAALLGSCACIACAGGGEAPQLMVEVVDGSGGALRIPEELDAFEIRVASLGGGTDAGAAELVRFRRTWALAGAAGVELPQTLAIVPAPSGTGTVRIDVFGLKRGRVLQRITRTATFGPGIVRLPPFALTPLCFGVVCPEGQTCESDGTCRDRATLDGGPGGDGGVCGPDLVACGDRCIPYDDANCGGCGVACPAGERCISNTCACGVGLARCGAACVDLQGDVAHCGACDAACALPHAASACTDGSCSLVECDAGWDDCNGLSEDGCEADLANELLHCGACDNRCYASGGTPICAAGRCAVGACDGSLADCDGADWNGCETDVRSDARHCGRCDQSCDYPNATGTCVSGTCMLGGCAGGWADCDGAAANGCEARLDCVAGAACTTSCGSAGTRACGDPCASTCSAPSERCNAADDDCDGRCDELGGCREDVHRGYDGRYHVFSTDLSLVTAAGLEVSSFFWVYVSDPGGFTPLHRCPKTGGGTFLTRSSICEGQGSPLEILGWVANSPVCGALPLYRLFKDGNHFYTTSPAERDTAVSTYGYAYESIEGYVFGAASG